MPHVILEQYGLSAESLDRGYLLDIVGMAKNVETLHQYGNDVAKKSKSLHRYFTHLRKLVRAERERWQIPNLS